MAKAINNEAICHLCRCNHSLFQFNIENYGFYRCADCGLVYLWPQPDALESTYTLDYYRERSIFEASPLNKYLYNKYLNILETLSPKTNRKLLDVGCGPGCFMEQAQLRDWKTDGVDISKEAIQYARSNHKLNVYQGDIFQFVCPDYDVITFWDVLEHLTKPLEHLLHAYKLLKPEGVLAVSTSNIAGLSTRIAGSSSCIFNPKEHLYFFSFNTLRQLLAKARFHVIISFSQTIYMRNIASLLNKVVKRGQINNPSYKLFYNIFQNKGWLRIMRIANRILNVPFLGDQLIVYAKKQ